MIKVQAATQGSQNHPTPMHTFVQDKTHSLRVSYFQSKQVVHRHAAVALLDTNLSMRTFLSSCSQPIELYGLVCMVILHDRSHTTRCTCQCLQRWRAFFVDTFFTYLTSTSFPSFKVTGPKTFVMPAIMAACHHYDSAACDV